MPVGTCLVTWRAMSARVDGADPDRAPDVVPLPGLTVRFSARVRRVSDPSEPRTIFLEDLVVTTDGDGYLISPDGQQGVYLVASDADVAPSGWTWTVSVSSPSMLQTSMSFVAPSGGVVDLATVLPAPPSSGADVAGWLAAVEATGAARDGAVVAAGAAAADAATAVAARAQAVAARDEAVPAATTAAAAASTAVAARDATLAASTIVGAGRPDVPGSMTAPVKALVDAATSGAVFRSTTGPQGAWTWQRRGSTWVCVEGDTGTVDLTAFLAADWELASGGLAIGRRTQDVLWLTFDIQVKAAAPVIGTARSALKAVTTALPLQWQSSQSFRAFCAAQVGSVTPATAGVVDGWRLAVGLSSGTWAAGDRVRFTLPLQPSAAYPVTL